MNTNLRCITTIAAEYPLTPVGFCVCKKIQVKSRVNAKALSFRMQEELLSSKPVYCSYMLIQSVTLHNALGKNMYNECVCVYSDVKKRYRFQNLLGA